MHRQIQETEASSTELLRDNDSQVASSIELADCSTSHLSSASTAVFPPPQIQLPSAALVRQDIERDSISIRLPNSPTTNTVPNLVKYNNEDSINRENGPSLLNAASFLRTRLSMQQDEEHSFMRKRRRLWRKPQLVTDPTGPESMEHKTTWEELFYDMVYVAGISRLVYQIKTEFTVSVTLTVCLFFSVFWWNWHSSVGFFSRFRWEDRISHIVFFIHMVGVAGMVINSSSGFCDKVGFAAGFLVSKIGLLLMYVVILRHVRRARYHALLAVASIIISCVIWFVSIWIPNVAVTTLLWLVSLSVELFAMAIYPLPKKHRIKVHIGHIAERQGLWIMILLGEPLVSLIISPSMSTLGTWKGMDTTNHILFLILAFLLTFLLHLNYFDVQPIDSSDITRHAMHRSRLGGRLVLILHFFLSFAILGIGVGFKLAVQLLTKQYPPGLRESLPLYLSSISTGWALLMMQIIRFVHQAPETREWLSRLEQQYFPSFNAPDSMDDDSESECFRVPAIPLTERTATRTSVGSVRTIKSIMMLPKWTRRKWFVSLGLSFTIPMILFALPALAAHLQPAAFAGILVNLTLLHQMGNMFEVDQELKAEEERLAWKRRFMGSEGSIRDGRGSDLSDSEDDERSSTEDEVEWTDSARRRRSSDTSDGKGRKPIYRRRYADTNEDQDIHVVQMTPNGLGQSADRGKTRDSARDG